MTQPLGRAITLVLVLVVSTGHAAAAAPSPDSLIAEAHGIVAVEILDTDYTRTAADGPMYADAKVLAVAKGPFAPSGRLKFGESAWCGPDYRKKEQRILFLQRVRSREYFRSARWATACRPGDRLNVFIAPEGLGRLSLPVLRNFLAELQAARRIPPRVQVTVVRERSGWRLMVSLTNPASMPLWVRPSRMMVSFEAGGVRFFRALKFAEGRPDWVSLAPGQRITGTVFVAASEARSETRIVLTLSHAAVYFPYRSWAGIASITVRLAP